MGDNNVLDGATAVATFRFAGHNPGDEVTYDISVCGADGSELERTNGTLPEEAAQILAMVIAVETSPKASAQTLTA